MTRTAALAALLATLALAACGGGDGGAGPGAAPSDAAILAQPAPSLVALGAASIARRPYHLRLAGNDGQGDILLDANVDGDGNLLGTMSWYGHAGDFGIIGGRLFLKGADLITQETGVPTTVSTWVRYVAHPLAYLDTLRQGALLGQCFADLGGTESVGPRGSVNGQDAVEVDGAGDAQGGAPTKLYLSLGNATVVLRWVVAHSGQAPPDSCNGGQATNLAAAALPAGTIDISNVGTAVTIRPPSGAVDAQ